MKAVRTGKTDKLADWLAPELVFEGGDAFVRVSHVKGRECLLIGIYALHLTASDIAVEVLGGWPSGQQTRADLRVKVSGIWTGRGGSYSVGEAFSFSSTLSFEFENGIITSLIERP